MASNLPRFTIRIDPKLMKKFRYISEYNARSANREIEILIKAHVSDFEKNNHIITLEHCKKYD